MCWFTVLVQQQIQAAGKMPMTCEHVLQAGIDSRASIVLCFVCCCVPAGVR
jgi:hypothetical protein